MTNTHDVSATHTNQDKNVVKTLAFNASLALGSDSATNPVLDKLYAQLSASLQERPLTAEDWQALLATLWPWCQEMQTGMLALALNLLEDWLIVDPWQASQRVSPLLKTIIQQFGLTAEFPYQTLFLNSAQKVGVTAEQITQPRYMLFAGKKLSVLIHEYYHKRGTAHTLGFHLALITHTQLLNKAIVDGLKNHDIALPFCQFVIRQTPEQISYANHLIIEYLSIFPEYKIDIIEGQQALLPVLTELLEKFHEVLSA